MDISHLRLERVLCAVTFSPSARKVVAWAAALAGAHDAEVRLFHVLPGSEARGAATPDIDGERALERLAALARPLPGRPRISAAVTEGDAVSEIARHARLVKADLLVIGMPAADGSASPLVTRLAAEARCPVLAVDDTVAAPETGGRLDRMLVAGSDAPPSPAADCRETTRSAMAFAGKTRLLVPERSSSPRRGLRRHRSD